MDKRFTYCCSVCKTMVTLTVKDVAETSLISTDKPVPDEEYQAAQAARDKEISNLKQEIERMKKEAAEKDPVKPMIRSTSWKKGQSGNLKGRPKKQVVHEEDQKKAGEVNEEKKSSGFFPFL